MEGIRYLDRTSDRLRRAVLILTDNLGENYRLRDEEVIESLLRASVLLEGIIVGNNVRQPPAGTRPTKDADITLPNVFWIASETGGEAVISSAATQAFPDLVARIRIRYSLQYRPHGPNIPTQRCLLAAGIMYVSSTMRQLLGAFSCPQLEKTSNRSLVTVIG
jgi:hypothetical protein